MKVPLTFIPDKDLEKKIEQFLQSKQDERIPSTGIVYDDISKYTGIFQELEQVILYNVQHLKDRKKYLKDLETAKAQYKEEIKKILIKCELSKK